MASREEQLEFCLARCLGVLDGVIELTTDPRLKAKLRKFTRQMEHKSGVTKEPGEEMQIFVIYSCPANGPLDAIDDLCNELYGPFSSDEDANLWITDMQVNHNCKGKFCITTAHYPIVPGVPTNVHTNDCPI